MKILLTAMLTLFSLQSNAVVLPADSIPYQVQSSLTRASSVLYWNEGVWIDSIKMPYAISEETKAAILAKSLDEWMTLAAKGESEEGLKAQSAMGVAYLYGVGVDQDEKLGLTFLKYAANKGRASAATHTAIAYFGGIGNLTEDAVEAIKWYKLSNNLNQENGVKNVFDLGAVYTRAAEQATVRKNYKKAVEIHKEALDYGSTDSAVYLAALYTAGLGVKKDIDEALKYAKQIDVKTLFDNDEDYKKFGNKLSPETIVALIRMNVSSWNADVYIRSSEHHQARLMLSKALDKNDPIGVYVAYKAALDVNDYKYAVYALNKAADEGLPIAQYEQARDLIRLNAQPARSLDLLKEASESGYGKSYLRYGTELYNSGNHKEALKWLRKASEYEAGTVNNNGKPYIGVATDNYIQSVELLAKLYFNGNGIERDKGKAAELIDELIKQVNGKLNMRKIQVSPNAEWRPNDFNSRDEQIQYYNNQLNSYMSKSAELVNLKRMMMDIKQ